MGTTARAAIVVFLGILGAGGVSAPLDAQYVKDVARVDGIRQEYLKGPGLVLGLPGTGDSTRSALTRKIYNNYLRNLDLDVSDEDFRSKNVALVMVTANVSSATKKGTRFDVTVSSMGDAKSLKGGWLLETPLLAMGAGAVGDTVFGIAQGGVQVMSEEEPTVGRGTAILEVELSDPARLPKEAMTLILDRPDFSTANRIARSINEFPFFVLREKAELPLAHALDSGTVRVKVPRSFRGPHKVVDFISRVMGEVQIEDVDRSALVVIDSKSGMVTVNGRVRVAPVFVSIGEVQIRIPPRTEPGADVQFDPRDRNPLLLDVLDSLREQGVEAKDLPRIIQGIDRAGALMGKLVEL